ncbi:MAG: AraC family transcriptional regulator [Cyanobacteria bacterium P01_F01_bin.150]
MQTFLNPPISTSVTSNWTGLVLEYCQQPACILPECEIAWHTLTVVQTQRQNTRVKVNGEQQRQPAKSGEVWILPANQISQSQWDGSLAYFRLLIEPDWLRSVAQTVFQQRAYCLDLQLQITDPLVHQILLNLHRVLIEPQSGDSLYVDTLGHSLGAHLLKRYAQLEPPLTTTQTAPKRDFSEAIAYIHDNLSAPIQLANLAQVVYMNPNYFAEQFKQAMGLSPYRYVTQCRVQKAQKLLRDPRLSIATVAQQVGIHNPSHFARLFRQWTGLSPSAYRRQR